MSDYFATDLYAWVADDEGIVAAFFPGTGGMPLVSMDRRVAEKLEPLAKSAAVAADNVVRLVRFHRAEVLKTHPKDAED